MAFGQLASAFAMLGGIRLLTEYVPPDVFGNISLLLGVASLGSGIFCLPLLQAALRFYPEMAKKGELSIFRRTIGKSLSWSTALSIGIILLGGAIYSTLQGFSYFAFLSLAGLLALEAVRALQINFLTAARKQRLFSVWVTAESLARPVLAILAVIVIGSTPQNVLLGYLVGTGLIFLVFVLPLKKQHLAEEPKPFKSASGLSKEIWHYALPLIPLAIVGWISSLGDRFIIAGFLGLGQVGIYAAAYGLISRIFNMVGSIIELTLRPIYFNAVSSGNRNLESHIFRLWVTVTILVCGLGVLAIFILKNWIAFLLLAQDYRTSSSLLPWIACGISFLTIAYVFEKPCYAYMHTKWILLIQSVGAVISIPAIIALVILKGVQGAAMAVPIYYGIQLIISWLVASKVINWR